MNKQSLLLFVGTYTAPAVRAEDQAHGIYAYRFDMETGTLSLANELDGVDSPSFLAFGRSGKTLYAVNEMTEFGSPPDNAVSAFSVHKDTGALRPLNQQRSWGEAPCHVSVDLSGRFVLIANYMSGSVVLYPIEKEGRLGPSCDQVQHQGHGPNNNRQEGPHAHSITPAPGGRFLLSCDLGIDQVMVYRLDSEEKKLVRHSEISLHPGAGPRHLDFHPNHHIVYVINELDATLSVMAWDGNAGTLKPLQTLSTLPEGVSDPKSCADVHVHPSGRFVYGSNRGHDSIVIYSVDPETGLLALVGHESTRGKTPRSFTIDPSGTFLLAANQESSTVVVFRIDQETGRLTYISETHIPTPTCLKFLQ